MNSDFPQIIPMGEKAILVKFKPGITEEKLQEVLFYKELIVRHYIKYKVEVINTFDSLLIFYHYSIEDFYSENLTVEKLISEAKVTKIESSKIFCLPVCYDEEFGLDLELLSQQKQLTVEQIIQLHTTPVYTVYFMGFLPGFLYLGGLDKKLRISRKNEPRMEVQKGAVGIGENQTGIYPKASPGGWQIIGNCPVSFFDKNSDPPSEISAGDKVKFYAVTKDEFREISGKVSEGKFQLKKEIYEG